MTSVRVLSNSAWTLAQSDPTVLAFDTPNYTTPTSGQWWIYYPGGGIYSKDRSGGIGTLLGWDFRLVCVGRSYNQVLNVADKADALFRGRSLDGNSSTSPLIQVANGATVLPDEGDPIGPRFTLTREYQLTTRS